MDSKMNETTTEATLPSTIEAIRNETGFLSKLIRIAAKTDKTLRQGFHDLVRRHTTDGIVQLGVISAILTGCEIAWREANPITVKTVGKDGGTVEKTITPTIPGSYSVAKSTYLKLLKNIPTAQNAHREYCAIMKAELGPDHPALAERFTYPEGFLVLSDVRYTDVVDWARDVKLAEESAKIVAKRAEAANDKRKVDVARTEAAAKAAAGQPAGDVAMVPQYGKNLSSAIEGLNIELRAIWGADDLTEDTRARITREMAAFARDMLNDVRAEKTALGAALDGDKRADVGAVAA